MKKIIDKFSYIPKIKLQFSLLEFLFFGACAAYYPFFVLYMQELGFSNTTIGTIIAINSFIVIIAPTFWGIVSDWLRSIRKVFILCMSTASVLLLSLPFIESALLMGLILSIVTFFESTLAPLLDSWVVNGIKSHNGNMSYGGIRLWGSLGYAVMVLLFSVFIDATSTAWVFPFYAVMALPAIISILRTKSQDTPQPISFKDLNIGRLFKNFSYIALLIFSIGVLIPHRATFIFLPNIIESVGGRREQVGFLFSLVALSEIPMFILSAKLIPRFKPVHIISIAAFFFIFRQVLYFASSTPLHIMLIQLTHGPSFALHLTGIVYYVYELAPSELKATAQTVLASLSFGLSGIIGSYGGGFVIDTFGLKTLYLIGVILSIVSAAFFLTSSLSGKLSKQAIS